MIGSFFEISNNNYQSVFALFFGAIFSINFCIDLLFLSNKRKTPNAIDLRLCWIKCIIAIIGIFTILSGIYFFIISVSMSSSRKKIKFLENKNYIPKYCQKCFSEIKNQNSTFCTNCGENLLERKYPAVFDENLLQDQQIKSKKNFSEAISQKGISESPYPQNKTENAIIFPKITKKTTAGSIRWSGAGQSITVNKYTIQNPFTYWSDGPCSPQEASCIDITLPVGNPDIADSHTLPYWPPYSRFTPDQRARYLSWLAHGKTGDLENIGYAFVYFYGLERRAIVENKDIDEILKEAHRLLSQYSSSKSFNQYLRHFIGYVIARRINEINHSTITQSFPNNDELDYHSLMTVLSWYGVDRKITSWELAYSIARFSQKTQKNTILKKYPALFKNLFEKTFSSHFPDGFKIKSFTQKHNYYYQAASPTFANGDRSNISMNFIQPVILNVPDINSSEFKAIFSVWDECIEALKPVSAKLSKSEGAITRDVFSALPDILKKEIGHPDLQLWQSFLLAKTPLKGSITVQVSEIASLFGIDERETLTSTQCRTIIATVQDIGYLLLPDQKISGTSYKWKDSVAVIPINNSIQISEKFLHAALIFEMAHTVAASDDNVSEIEENFLHKFISEQFSLNDFEIECLKGLQRVLEIQPPSLSRIGKRLGKHLNPEQKVAIAKFLGDIVLLDNKFVKEEQKSLKTVFKALEIDPAVSDELIKKFLVGQIPDELITVSKSGKTRMGEAIPPPVIKPEFSINRERLKQTMEDTRAVQDILASVFEQEEEEMEIEIEPEVKIPETPVKTYTRPGEFDLPFPSETIPSLDTKYLSMLHEIMKSDEMSQEDFTGLARKYNLMPRAAFDDINTWADEELGDFLLEENESRIVINYQK